MIFLVLFASRQKEHIKKNWIPPSGSWDHARMTTTILYAVVAYPFNI
ncbi:hypothetical protein ACFLSV_06765 [Bacteroidota bacterium]